MGLAKSPFCQSTPCFNPKAHFHYDIVFVCGVMHLETLFRGKTSESIDLSPETEL